MRGDGKNQDGKRGTGELGSSSSREVSTESSGSLELESKARNKENCNVCKLCCIMSQYKMCDLDATSVFLEVDSVLQNF